MKVVVVVVTGQAEGCGGQQGPERQTQSQGVEVCGGGGADIGGDDRRQGWEALLPLMVHTKTLVRIMGQ